ncbi:hypothetical protein ACO0K0_19045 [Undibacterium sp. SXout11W]|uniref:hypothetical protein n=1 Tax=Undibacterium sp. SXout11W TaxID=3413050 RepID=UPI003BEFA004
MQKNDLKTQSFNLEQSNTDSRKAYFAPTLVLLNNTETEQNFGVGHDGSGAGFSHS